MERVLVTFSTFSEKSVKRAKMWILARRLGGKLIFEGPRSQKAALLDKKDRQKGSKINARTQHP